MARLFEKIGFPVERVLERRTSIQQKLLTREERVRNSLNAYAIREGSSEKIPERAIILDDVYTTGATIDACAAALIGNGTKIVSAIVIAAD
jgi:predicted amidophosphoribosyltransferase